MKRILVLLAVLVLVLVPTDAHADIAPPAQPPGSDLQPGTGSTQVRMLAETVLIDVKPGASDKDLGLARVTASFTMRNTGAVSESMAVRFPIGASDGFFNVNELRDLRVKVNGHSVSTRRIVGEDPYRGNDPVPWAEFDVTFPSGSDTAVEVQYTLKASGEYPYIWFKYILSTGAGWNGTIGAADIIVQVPYAASDQNILLQTDQTSFGTTKGGDLQGNTIRWHYEDLEPAPEDNFEVDLVMLGPWQRLLDEQANVAKNPQDGEAWGRLAKLCKEMAFSSRGKGFRGENSILDAGATELYQQSLQAYDKAVTLLPKDPLWHAGYADLLYYHGYFAAYTGVDTREEVAHSMREIQTALALAPQDPKVQQIAEQISGSFPDGMQQNGSGYDFPWLTALPPASTQETSPTEIAALPLTETSLPATPTSAPSAQPTSGSKSASPICGGAALALPLLAVVAFRRPVRRSKH